jgi:uncharacterized membrane protein YkvI
MNIIKVSSVYIGTIIGAGFASGQEVLKFFVVYGRNSIYGIFFSSVLFSAIGIVVLNKVYKYKISNYYDYIPPIIGILLSGVVEIIICLFLLSSYCVMVAGSGAIFSEQFQVNRGIGILLMTVLCFVVFLYDLKGIVIINTFLSPLMMTGIVILCTYIVISKDSSVFSTTYISKAAEKVFNNWLSSSMVYVSYNTLTIVVIMTAMLPLLTKRSVAIIGGLLGGLSLGAVAFVMWFVLKIYYADIIISEIPFLQIVMRRFEVAEPIYVFILYSAMFTTAVSSGFGLLGFVNNRIRISKRISAAVLSLIAIPLAFVGFANLLGFLYPLFGYIGILLVGIILFDGIREIIKS